MILKVFLIEWSCKLVSIYKNFLFRKNEIALIKQSNNKYKDKKKDQWQRQKDKNINKEAYWKLN